MSEIANILVINGKRPYSGSFVVNGSATPDLKEAPYLPSQGLIKAVNLAIFLEKRPLLLKGEPGCGKTRLAAAVARELDLNFEAWYIKSTSRAQDGLYKYDAVKRLYDVQLASLEEKSKERAGNIENYIELGQLGRAFDSDKSTVLLIDEIDKADIDFPNDLLRELDERKFLIAETGKTIQAKHPPIVIITSNDEKDLPEAFLRRCLFYSIPFPSLSEMVAIVKAHFPDSSREVVEGAVRRFQVLRKEMENKKAGKKVSTSELLDWFSVLTEFSKDEALEQLQGKLPFSEILLKKWEDHEQYLINEI
jgi:MoxR-like ATPase